MMVKVNEASVSRAVDALLLALPSKKAKGKDHQKQIAVVVHDRVLSLFATNGDWIARWQEPVVEGYGVTGRETLRVRDVDASVLRAGLIDLDAITDYELGQDPLVCAHLYAACEPRPTDLGMPPHVVVVDGCCLGTIARAFQKVGFDRMLMRFGDALDPVWIFARHCALSVILMPVRQ